MKKFDVLNRIASVGVVAVVRAENEEKAIKISEACINGGVPAIEMTFTVPGAAKCIETLKKTFPADKLIVGAGTVLDSETARAAILAGAEYIVSPGFDLDTAKLCNRYQVPYMPGCMTITEILHAMEAGCDIIKLFPFQCNLQPRNTTSRKALLPYYPDLGMEKCWLLQVTCHNRSFKTIAKGH